LQVPCYYSDIMLKFFWLAIILFLQLFPYYARYKPILGRQVLCKQKGWDGEHGLVHPKGENSMAVSGLGCESSSVGPFLLFKHVVFKTALLAIPVFIA